MAKLIRRAFDLHVHIGPEMIPRKYTATSLIKSEQGTMAGMALKNHFFPTTPFIAGAPKTSLTLIGSVVLNNFVGGLNADVIYSTGTLSRTRFIVWFPTVNAKQFLDTSKWEIAPEWVRNSSIRSRASKTIKPITVWSAKRRLSKQCIEVLYAIKKTNAILATGHIAWQESYALVSRARRMGIKQIIITHPIYQRIAMPIAIQKNVAAQGCKIELCWSMWKIDNIPIATIAKEINAIGAKNCILSSDSGQIFSPAPSEALMEFCTALQAEGITQNNLTTMLITNPKILLGIDTKRRKEVNTI